MPSLALAHWEVQRRVELNEILSLHRSVAGRKSARRQQTRQISHAYAVLLASQFQGFCRDLHSESLVHLMSPIGLMSLQAICQSGLARHRKLDHGNPNSGNVGSDFNALGVKFWPQVHALDPKNQVLQNRVERLCEWRNAIAHQDASSPLLGTLLIRGRVLAWHEACDRLAEAFDQVMGTHIRAVTGVSPW